MFLDSGRKPEYPERTHAYTGEHANYYGPSWELNLEYSRCEAVTVITTTPEPLTVNYSSHRKDK